MPTWIIVTYIISVIIMMVLSGILIYQYNFNTEEWIKDPEDFWMILAFCILTFVPGVNSLIIVLFAGMVIKEEYL